MAAVYFLSTLYVNVNGLLCVEFWVLTMVQTVILERKAVHKWAGACAYQVDLHCIVHLHRAENFWPCIISQRSNAQCPLCMRLSNQIIFTMVLWIHFTCALHCALCIVHAPIKSNSMYLQSLSPPPWLVLLSSLNLHCHRDIFHPYVPLQGSKWHCCDLLLSLFHITQKLSSEKTIPTCIFGRSLSSFIEGPSMHDWCSCHHGIHTVIVTSVILTNHSKAANHCWMVIRFHWRVFKSVKYTRIHSLSVFIWNQFQKNVSVGIKLDQRAHSWSVKRGRLQRAHLKIYATTLKTCFLCLKA